jgi:hypothetical protein
MGAEKRAVCQLCIHFRSAPYEARLEGCYLPKNMVSKQSARYLDEQQLPGDHEVINRLGDCPDYERRPARKGLLQRIFSKTD